MPTFIVHELGKPPKTATVQESRIVIGRDDSCHLVLNNVSISRHHADIRQADPVTWVLIPMNLDNPILVNGRPVTGQHTLTEGAELQLGRFMVVFSLETKARAEYTKDRGQYEAVCAGCGWKGVLSALAQAPTCPRCGGVNFSRADDISSQMVRGSAISGPTAYLSSGDVQKMSARLQEAKKARIERVGNVPGLPHRFDLAEDKICTFGKQGRSEMPLEGFMLGKPAAVLWERVGYVIHKGGFWPSLSVNGNKTATARLKSGDSITLGGNHFRFIVG